MAALVMDSPSSLLGGSAAGLSGAGSQSSSVDAFWGGLLLSYIPMGSGLWDRRSDEQRRRLVLMRLVGSKGGGGGGSGWQVGPADSWVVARGIF